MNGPSEDWLERANSRFAQENVEHRHRPWQAWRELAREVNLPISLSDPAVKRIFDWFRDHTKAGSQLIGPMYVGAFYYDVEVWPITVPVFYGTVQLNVLDSLPSMPEAIKRRLLNDGHTIGGLNATFADCLDVALQAPELEKTSTLAAFGRQLLGSGRETLGAAVELLLLARPNPKALGNARFATEILLKSFLAVKEGLNEEKARKDYGHRLDKLLARALEVAPNSDFCQLQPRVGIFPPVEERYESNQWPLLTLWNGYSFALHTAATVVRLISGKDVRKGMNSN